MKICYLNSILIEITSFYLSISNNINANIDLFINDLFGSFLDIIVQFFIQHKLSCISRIKPETNSMKSLQILAFEGTRTREPIRNVQIVRLL